MSETRRITPKRRLSAEFREKIIREQEKRPQILSCVHLGESTGIDGEQEGCGGCGARPISLWECEVFGLCSPFARGKVLTEGVQKCRGCPRFQTSAGF